MRILYVEDNPANLFLIKRVAKMGDHEVINLIDGEEALRKIDIIKPDLILMDIQLAGQLTGLDVVRKLRQDGLTVPIVAVTAYAMVGDRERCLEAGCNEYLSKPLPIGRVVELLQLYQAGVPAKVEKESDEVYLPLDKSADAPLPAASSAPVETVTAAAPAPVETAAPTASPVSDVAAQAPAAPATADAPAVPNIPEETPTEAAKPSTPELEEPDSSPLPSTLSTSAPAAVDPAAPVEGNASSSAGLSEPPASQGGADLSQPSHVPPSSMEHKAIVEPPIVLSGTDILSDPAVESTSQDTSHPQDTVQAQ
jgi:two-component system cell cycle response regulator DivK